MNHPIKYMVRAQRLLDSIDWKSCGYTDKVEWLRDKYGQKPASMLYDDFIEQFKREGLL